MCKYLWVKVHMYCFKERKRMGDDRRRVCKVTVFLFVEKKVNNCLNS